MYQIQTLNKISRRGLSQLDAARYTVSDGCAAPDGILVRSADMHGAELPPSLLAIARAGAGVNNIPVADCAAKGIVVFNTPGANANAVKELVLAGLFLASRKITDGVAWASTLKEQGGDVPKLVEKGKGQFAGPEIAGKKLGVIGLGAIGVLVANAAVLLGMEVCGFDPYMTVRNAWSLSRSVHPAASMDEIFAECDYITVHVPLLDSTRGMIGAESIGKMKDGVRLLNFARGELADTDAVLAAVHAGKVACYVTDFPNERLLGVENVVCIPHLGASTPESEENCAEMAARELAAYLEDGTIRNSVNYPDAELARTPGTSRLCFLHRNVPMMLNRITAGLSGLNIEHMLNKSRGDVAYTILDVSGEVDPSQLGGLSADPDFYRVRVL